MTAAVAELHPHHRRSGALLTLGVVLLVLGALALLAPFAATLAATLVVGLVLTVGGVAALAHTPAHRGEHGFWQHAAWGVVAILTGLALIFFPANGAVSLTLMVAVAMLVQGVIVSVYAVGHRGGARHGWVWLLLAGVVAVISGLLLFLGLPFTAIWTPGLIVAINFLVYGGAMTAAGLGWRRSL